MGSGELSRAGFVEFLKDTLAAAAAVSHDGAVHYVCMDWRHIGELLEAVDTVYDATLSHARKRGIKYRYYLSSALHQGLAAQAGSIDRVSAADIEMLVAKAVRAHLKPAVQIDDRSLIKAYVARVEVQPEQLVIQLEQAQKAKRQSKKGDCTLRVPWHKIPSTRGREILIPTTTSIQRARPIRSETRATLVASIARGRRWLDELITDLSATTESIAERERCSVRKINMTISLAFLAPDLVKAAVEGRLPHGMSVARLCDLPAEWSRQHQVLGLTSQ
jgi:site-specific DNA recombinase